MEKNNKIFVKGFILPFIKIILFLIENMLLIIVSLFESYILADWVSGQMGVWGISIIGCIFFLIVFIVFRICLFIKNMFRKIAVKYIKPSIIILSIYWLVLVISFFIDHNFPFIMYSTMIVVMTGHIILIRRRQHLIHTIEKYCPWIKIEYCNIFNYREKTRRFNEELKLIEDSNISEIVKDAIMGADSIIPMLILHMEGIYLAGIFLLSVQGYLFYTSVGN